MLHEEIKTRSLEITMRRIHNRPPISQP